MPYDTTSIGVEQGLSHSISLVIPFLLEHSDWLVADRDLANCQSPINQSPTKFLLSVVRNARDNSSLPAEFLYQKVKA
jgi:hypothetical protein